jgi:hypothetical protein
MATSGEARKREVITLQVGGVSNWVGAHLWNLDKAGGDAGIAESPLYVESSCSSSPRAPRVVAFDLRGRQGALFADDYAAELPDGDVAAAREALLRSTAGAFGGVVQHVAEPFARNPYLAALRSDGQDDEDGEDGEDSRRREKEAGAGGQAATSFFDDEVDWSSYGNSGFAERARALLMGDGRDDEEKEEEGEEGEEEGGNDGYGDARGGAANEDPTPPPAAVEVPESFVPERWSEFIEVRLPPRSFVEVPFWDVRNGQFSSFAAGNLHQASGCELSVDERDAALDRLRLLLEECDHVQGWACTVDAQGGFGGLGAALAAEARDQPCRCSWTRRACPRTSRRRTPTGERRRSAAGACSCSSTRSSGAGRARGSTRR